MGMNFFSRRAILRSTNSMDLIPVRIAMHELSADMLVTLVIPKFKNEKFANWFIPKSRSKYFQIHLDEIGSALWLEIDGERNIADLGKTLEEKFGKRVHPTEETVTKFMSSLYNNRYVTFKQLKVISEQ